MARAGPYPGPVALYRDAGIVLRVQKLGEADRIVTMLTRRHGKIRAVAKGVRRTRSRWGARLEPFNHVDVQCYTGRSLDVITQAQTLDAFAPAVVADYGAYSCGCAILETADRLVAEEGEPALRVYLLLLGAARALADGVREPSLVLDAFLLRGMSHAGWSPSISECARCAEPGPHRAFSVAGGGAVCGRCRPPGSVTPAAETFGMLDALLHGDWDVADAATAAVRRETSGLVAAHLQWHMERQLRSLPLVERQMRERPRVTGEPPDREGAGL
ncbi:DNA replication and repair protein RecO [Pseudonocardia endophytica]|uniref:DNA repair protein RecO n=1 Tax=Pseudonocardia endophytica TaxID=401976 RepID=A0A4R1HLP9_PSEEN|nr:DNA replication and repair protein RecO [Pseudonocardia endophytica]